MTAVSKGFATGIASNGFTALGSGNSPIKVKVLTGTTGAAEGSDASVAHGLTGAKIIGIMAKIEYNTNTGVLPGFVAAIVAEYEYGVSHDSTTIYVKLHPTNSANLTSKPFTLVVLYVE